MGKTMQKFAQVCKKSDTQLEGLAVPVGAIYGRIGNNYFVCSDLTREHRKVQIKVKRGICAWTNEKIPVTSDIYELVMQCAEKNNLNKPEKAQKVGENSKKKHYVEYGTEFNLPDDYQDSKYGPKRRKVAEFDGKRRKPFASETEDGRSEYENEIGFWVVYKEMDRRLAWDPKYGGYM